MDTIKIDFEVFKALTAKRRTAEMTYNDVLREMLGLGKRGQQEKDVSFSSSPRKGDLTWKGVTFPVGAEFRASYKGKQYLAKIVNGAIQFADGYRAKSPSEAAHYVTKTSVNGWRFWECRFSNEMNWASLEAIRLGKDLV